MIKKAIYPGTFDPITYGHLNIIERSTTIFEKIILAISENYSKNTMFSLNERIIFAKKETEKLNNVEVVGFSELVVNLANKHNTNILIRSVRSILDFEYEYKLASINKCLMNKIETVFLFPSPEFSVVSSSVIKKIAKYGGNISSFLPKEIAKAVQKKISKKILFYD